MSRSTLIYDGACAFCCRGMAWFQARDCAGRLEYLPRDSAVRRARFPQLDAAEYQGSMHVVLPDATLRSGAAAIAYALTQLPALWWRLGGAVLQCPGVRGLAAVAYRWIARNRHRWTCRDDSCRLP
ncbi:MAG: DUF393 domain-containing protein [Deltaproteobacteria bacterium]|nr:DUF393 domain-containing protein [Deltaproteobacteria bacterium]